MQPMTLTALIARLAAVLTVLWTAQPATAASSRAKLQSYIECTNALSGRAYEAQSRYFSWAAKSGPTGKEKIIYGLYTISDTADCQRGIVAATTLEPRNAELETAGTAYAKAVGVLGPLLKEADDYYDQKNFKDDKMAKGKALHPLLVAAWNDFTVADDRLRASIDVISDQEAIEELAAIEKREGRKGRYHIEALMMKAKRLVREESGEKPDLARITEALNDYEGIVKATEQYAAENKDAKIGSSLVGSAKSYLTTAKNLMRRIRDKTPYSTGERMIMGAAGGSGGAWMVEGSPARLTHDYNQLIGSYNRGARF